MVTPRPRCILFSYMEPWGMLFLFKVVHGCCCLDCLKFLHGIAACSGCNGLARTHASHPPLGHQLGSLKRCDVQVLILALSHVAHGKHPSIAGTLTQMATKKDEAWYWSSKRHHIIPEEAMFLRHSYMEPEGPRRNLM